jgi:hypothetical protein
MSHNQQSPQKEQDYDPRVVKTVRNLKEVHNSSKSNKKYIYHI